MNRTVIVIFSLLLVVLSADAGTIVLEGLLTYRYKISGDENDLRRFFEYANNSNSQRIIRREAGSLLAENTANLSRFTSKTPYPFPDYRQNKDLSDYLGMYTTREGYQVYYEQGKKQQRNFTEKVGLTAQKIAYLKPLAEKLTTGCTWQFQAVERMITYIKQHVSYQGGVSSDPYDVIRSGRAFCEGFANASVILLRLAGIPARNVNCYIPPGHMWGLGGGTGNGGPHAFIEVYYQDSGWVSCDPQASLHYVDPFHIVNYPQSGCRISELAVTDTTVIVDVRPGEPELDNFKMRKTTDQQHAAVFVGKITDAKGNPVTDSMQSGQWVYMQQSANKGQGIRIRENNQFVLSSAETGQSAELYFSGKNGEYFSRKIRFREITRVTHDFDFSTDKHSTLVYGKKTKLYFWGKTADGQWTIRELQTDQSGRLLLILEPGDYILSDHNITNGVKRLLQVTQPAGIAYAFTELPVYRDPDTRFVYGNVAGGNPPETDWTVQAMDERGYAYPAVKIELSGTYTLQVEDPAFHWLAFKSPGFIIIKQVDFSKANHIPVNINPAAAMRTIRIGKAAAVYINLKKDNSYSSLISGTSDDAGNLRLLLPSGTYFLSIGQRFSTAMQELQF